MCKPAVSLKIFQECDKCTNGVDSRVGSAFCRFFGLVSNNKYIGIIYCLMVFLE